VVRFIDKVYRNNSIGTSNALSFIDRAVKGAVMTNFGAVKGPEGAAISGKRSRGGLAGPGNPGNCSCQ
jgi:hypothetical protein